MIEKYTPSDTPAEDGFVLQLKDELLDALTAQAKENWRNLHSEIVFAIQSWLAGPTRMLRRKQILSEHIGAARSREVLGAVKHVNFRHAVGTTRQLIRLPPEMCTALADLSAERGLSENCLLLNALCWWVNISRDLHCLLEQAESNLSGAGPRGREGH